MRGIQISARYFTDIQNEWTMCFESADELEELSSTNMGFFYLNTSTIFPKLEKIQMYVIGKYKIDYLTSRNGLNWKHFSRYGIQPLKTFLENNPCPALKTIEIYWTPYTEFEISYEGAQDGYDKFGSIYEIEKEYEYEYINMEVFFEMKEKYKQCIEWSWLNTYPIEKLIVGKTFYKLSKQKPYNFTMEMKTLSSTENDVHKINEVLAKY